MLQKAKLLPVSLFTPAAVNPVTNRIYGISSSDSGTSIKVVNGTSNAVFATIPMGSAVGGIAVDPTTNRIYATLPALNKLVIVNGNTNLLVANVTVGSGPGSVDVNPATKKVYVVNNGARTVSVVQDATTGTLVTGSVTIAGTCGLAAVSGSPINYGTLTPSSTSLEQTLVLDNTGSVNATLSAKGTDWLDSGTPPTAQMLVGNTKFATTALVSYATKTALTTIDQTVGPILPTTNLDTFWQLQANLLSSSFAGSLTQTMDFTVTC